MIRSGLLAEKEVTKSKKEVEFIDCQTNNSSKKKKRLHHRKITLKKAH